MRPRSDLSVSEYARISDRTMDALLDRLEALVDDVGEPGWEVEYSVRCAAVMCARVLTTLRWCIGWCAHAEPGHARDVRGQQAAAEQADLAVVSVQVRRSFRAARARTLTRARSGPKRYDYDEAEGGWVYGRDGTTLRGLLEEELAAPFGPAIAERLGEGPFFQS
jgi:frataxin